LGWEKKNSEKPDSMYVGDRPGQGSQTELNDSEKAASINCGATCGDALKPRLLKLNKGMCWALKTLVNLAGSVSTQDRLSSCCNLGILRTLFRCANEFAA
jgi:hypothetical protein